MKKNITISEIAREAGVSKSTVSRVLNNKPDVLPETKERVRKIVRKYNFQPSAYAKGIYSKHTNMIGLVIPHGVDWTLKNHYYAEIQRGILHITQDRGYHVLLMYGRDLQEAVNSVMQKRVDGVLMVSPMEENKKYIDQIVKSGTPLVTIGKVDFCPDVVQYCTNNYRGACLAVEHLQSLGHKRIGYINGPLFLPSSRERLRGYLDTMAANGCEVEDDMIVEGRNSLESGRFSVKKIFDAHPDTTAFFVASDYMAIGALEQIRLIGKRVPEDISLVGFDNIPISGEVTPALTTIDQQVYEKGKIGADMLLDMIENKNIAMEKNREIACSLLVRGSTGWAKK